MSENLKAIFEDRRKTHGDFAYLSTVTQRIKHVMMNEHQTWKDLSYPAREALEMIAHKIGRILAGNPNHADHWNDIAGYATLVADQIRGANPKGQ